MMKNVVKILINEDFLMYFLDLLIVPTLYEIDGIQVNPMIRYPKMGFKF